MEVWYLGSGRSPMNLRMVIQTARAACNKEVILYTVLSHFKFITRLTLLTHLTCLTLS